MIIYSAPIHAILKSYDIASLYLRYQGGKFSEVIAGFFLDKYYEIS